ncbi:Smr/MutS family protein [Brevundimonas sp.]|uniref:Smr/MutS family protein n=1 Tax=Brevundimonas sp. TaxID=1871086 RepID=UPI003BAC1426
MKKGPRDLTPDDRRIWARVSGSVTPPKTRKAARVTPVGTLGGAPIADPVATVDAPLKSSPPKSSAKPPRPTPRANPTPIAAPPSPSKPAPRTPGRRPPEELEPRRHRRLSRERDPIEARIDLHGFGRFEAEDQLRAFLGGCQARGMRSVLVITGQGRLGGGVIRASVHEWLQAPALRSVVSGFAVSHRRHGGDGAIYVTLKPR